MIKKTNLKLATAVEGNLKTPFSIATSLRCRGGHYSFPQIAPLNLDPYLVMLSVKQGDIKYLFFFFESLVWFNLELNSGHLNHWQRLYSLGQWSGQIYVCVFTNRLNMGLPLYKPELKRQFREWKHTDSAMKSFSYSVL